ncbi:MAG TPA: hypothetical protein QGF02_00865 [Candidatus Babeliales bacterium]|nr:hypothetical protein [Candidatus Babeliales bacterium]
MKKLMLSLLTILAVSSSFQTAHAGGGKYFAAGLGGALLGSALTSASRRPRTVYVEEAPRARRRGSYTEKVRTDRRGNQYVKDEYGNRVYLDE